VKVKMRRKLLVPRRVKVLWIPGGDDDITLTSLREVLEQV
jgi:hypothetical protein